MVGTDYIFSSRWGYKLASLLWQGSRMGPRASNTHCLETHVRQECTLTSLVRLGHQFCPADRESHELCSLFKCQCKQGCWMGYTASHVL